jgi:uncharacterized protein (TIGR00290 family)
MPNAKKIVLNWSSGKDAALAYHLLSKSPDCQVVRLLTTINEEARRVVMHGLSEALLDEQVKRMNIPITKVRLPAAPDDSIYKTTLENVLNELKLEGISTAAFGDIFLEDLKTYREEQLRKAGFEAIFPLWKKDSIELISTIEKVGIGAMIVCVNEKYLDKSFLGRKIDTAFLNDLPDNVDPCGENGEFHTYVFNAPYFSAPIDVQKGEIVYKKYETENANWDTGFYFLDLQLNA